MPFPRPFWLLRPLRSDLSMCPDDRLTLASTFPFMSVSAASAPPDGHGHGRIHRRLRVGQSRLSGKPPACAPHPRPRPLTPPEQPGRGHRGVGKGVSRHACWRERAERRWRVRRGCRGSPRTAPIAWGERRWLSGAPRAATKLQTGRGALFTPDCDAQGRSPACRRRRRRRQRAPRCRKQACEIASARDLLRCELLATCLCGGALTPQARALPAQNAMNGPDQTGYHEVGRPRFHSFSAAAAAAAALPRFEGGGGSGGGDGLRDLEALENALGRFMGTGRTAVGAGAGEVAVGRGDGDGEARASGSGRGPSASDRDGTDMVRARRPSMSPLISAQPCLRLLPAPPISSHCCQESSASRLLSPEQSSQPLAFAKPRRERSSHVFCARGLACAQVAVERRESSRSVLSGGRTSQASVLLRDDPDGYRTSGPADGADMGDSEWAGAAAGAAGAGGGGGGAKSGRGGRVAANAGTSAARGVSAGGNRKRRLGPAGTSSSDELRLTLLPAGAPLPAPRPGAHTAHTHTSARVLSHRRPSHLPLTTFRPCSVALRRPAPPQSEGVSAARSAGGSNPLPLVNAETRLSQGQRQSWPGVAGGCGGLAGKRRWG